MHRRVRSLGYVLRVRKIRAPYRSGWNDTSVGTVEVVGRDAVEVRDGRLSAWVVACLVSEVVFVCVELELELGCG